MIEDMSLKNHRSRCQQTLLKQIARPGVLFDHFLQCFWIDTVVSAFMQFVVVFGGRGFCTCHLAATDVEGRCYSFFS